MPCTSVTRGTRESHDASLHSEPLNPCSGFCNWVRHRSWKNACVCSHAHLLVAQVLGARGCWGHCLAHLCHGQLCSTTALTPASRRQPQPILPGQTRSAPSHRRPGLIRTTQFSNLCRRPAVMGAGHSVDTESTCRHALPPGVGSSRTVSAPCPHRCLRGSRTISFSSVSDEGGRSRCPSPSRAHLAPGTGPGSPPAGPWVEEAGRFLENHLQTCEEPSRAVPCLCRRCSPFPPGEGQERSGRCAVCSSDQER